jgi:type II secretory ATPase GspE/PulE/Tfp pilus assembly ATPase PilB-like protein
MPMTDEIERLAIAKSPASKIQQEAIRHGMVTLKQDGIAKAQRGLVSLGDVMQATS